MNTPYSEIYELFLDRIINDNTFFLKNSDGTINIELIELKQKKLLNQAIYEILSVDFDRDFEINLDNKDNENNILLFEATTVEKNLIADFMFQCYVDSEYVFRLNELKRIGFTDSEIKYFSPANSLKEFMSSVNNMKNKNKIKVIRYLKRGRLDGKTKRYGFNNEESI